MSAGFNAALVAERIEQAGAAEPNDLQQLITDLGGQAPDLVHVAPALVPLYLVALLVARLHGNR